MPTKNSHLQEYTNSFSELPSDSLFTNLTHSLSGPIEDFI